MVNETPTEAASQSRESIGGDFVLPVLAVAFAIYYLYTIRDMANEAIFSGALVGFGLIALSLALMVRMAAQVIRRKADLGWGALARPVHLHGPRIALIILVAAHIFLIRWGGFTLTTFVFLMAAMFLLGVRSWSRLLGVAGGMSALGYALFIWGLQTRLPKGPVERLIEWVF